MMRHILKRIIFGVALLLSVASARAQFLDSTTGLLQMPTAVMRLERPLIAAVNYLNQHTTPEGRVRFFGAILNASALQLFFNKLR